MKQPDPIFVDEALANLDAMAQSLTAVMADGPGPERINTIFRHAHSIKGGAAAFGFGNVADLLHQAETLLDQWRKDRLDPDGDGVALLLESVALARDGLTGAPTDPSITQALLARLQAAASVQMPKEIARNRCIRISGLHGPDLVDVVTALFRDIAGLGAVLSVTGNDASPRVFTVRTPAADAELLDLLAMHVDRASIGIQDPPPESASPPSLPSPGVSDGHGASFVRVGLDELAQMDKLAAELSQVISELAAGPVQAEGRPLKAEVGFHVAHLEQIAQLLRQTLHRVRSAPVSDLFALVPPLLANLAHTLGKSFTLATSGESVRLDRRVIQGLADPLVQLVRNACDHGIESAQDRCAAGKPPDGRIALSADLRDGAAVLMVRDDGRGLSRSMLLQAAHTRGIDVAADAPDQDLWRLVFSPGLTTAGTVTPVSGRGVGMDVVRRKVAALGGAVEIESVPGSGTCVVIRLPVQKHEIRQD
ncbi:MAG: ATP-binding protein [Betaproteobacteria bacterium]